jgi:thiosulfate/3-mercaptopyruvate sulfurtransferase
MTYSTFISTAILEGHLDSADWAIVDCRFSLDDAERGRRDYLQSHIPGAVYAHLNEDLSGPIVPGKTGRHPLPEIENFCQTLGRWGIGPGVQVVVYDDSGGAMAARLWWMLRWLGHDAVAVLDGGWPRWHREGRPVNVGNESRPEREFKPNQRDGMVLDARRVEAILDDPEWLLLDSRSSERYRGENETIDPIAGHIPGAVSAPYADNLDKDEMIQTPEMLRSRFKALLADTPPERAVFYCGSGVSAAQNLLAMDYAGISGSKLYVGSWSEWITDPSRPISMGDD